MMSYNNKDEDVEKIFNQDVREKCKTKRGASARASRKRGFKGGMKTPSDFLSPKQRRELSGEVYCYMLNQVETTVDNPNELSREENRQIDGNYQETKQEIKQETNQENLNQGQTQEKPKILSLLEFKLLAKEQKIKLLDELTNHYTRVELAHAWNTTRDNVYNYCYRYIPEKYNKRAYDSSRRSAIAQQNSKNKGNPTKPESQTTQLVENQNNQGTLQNQETYQDPTIKHELIPILSEPSEILPIVTKRVFHLEFNKTDSGKTLKDRILNIMSILEDDVDYIVKLTVEGE